MCHLGYFKLFVLPTNENNIEDMVSKFYNSHGFRQCIAAEDYTRVGVKRPSLNASDFAKKKKKYALSIQVAVDYNYCFLTDDKMTRERTCVSIFSNSKLNAMLREGTVPAVGKLSLKENHLYLSVFRKMQHIHFCLT